MIDDGNFLPARRRRHSAEFKSQVINACLQPGVSIAATALRYGLNANMVRIWIRAHEKASTTLPEFVPVSLPAPVVRPVEKDIVVEIKRDATAVTIRWPGSATAECAQWLQNWLR